MNQKICKSCGLPIFHGYAGYAGPQCMCHWTNAAPRQPASNPFFDNRIARELLEDRAKQWPMSATRQPDGELEVVGYASECGLAVLRGLPITGAVQIKASAHKVHDVPLCRLSDAKRAIAELRESLADPEAVLVNMMRGTIARPSVRALSKLFGDVINDEDLRLLEIADLREECERLRKLNETRGDVLTGALHDLPAESMLDIHELKAERDTLRQQRNKMVGLLMEADASFVDSSEAGIELSDRIHATLAEVSK